MVVDNNDGKKLIQSVLGYSIEVRTGMNYFLEYCAKVQESPAWRKISDLDFEKDVANLQLWLNKALTEEPPVDDVRAFWFGLFHPIMNDGETSCGLYVSGSVNFDADDQAARWASLNDDSYLPKDSRAKSVILDEIYFINHQYKVESIGEYILCLGYACLAMKSACIYFGRSFMRGFYGPRAIAVGFDNGDFIFIDAYLNA
jgi:hypothetical protein